MTGSPFPQFVAYAVDAGGSSTTVAVRLPGARIVRRVFPSTAATTVGAEAAAAGTREYLDFVRALVPGGMRAYGCIASSSVPMLGEIPFDPASLALVREFAPPGQALVVNDVLPLLWAPPLDGVGVVVSCGTGSCVFGRDAGGRVAKVGGHEYVLSDEGSAYAIGLAALRAAVADFDAVGPSTPLRAQAEQLFGLSVPALGRWLAQSVDQRFHVARFAPLVCAAALAGEEPAQEILRNATQDLARLVTVALDALDLGPPVPIGFAGGVLRGCRRFRAQLVDAVRSAGHEPTPTLLDGPRAGLHLADQLAAQCPAGSFAGYAQRIAATALVTVP